MKYKYAVLMQDTASALNTELDQYGAAGWRCVGYAIGNDIGYSAVVEIEIPETGT